VIPAFEQEDDAVLDDLARSVDYWREALTRAGCGGGQEHNGVVGRRSGLGTAGDDCA
jgi:hypothetical protein